MRLLAITTAALGLLMVFSGLTERPRPRRPRRFLAYLDRLSAEAGYRKLGGSGLLALCIATSIALAASVAALTPLGPLHAAGAIAGGALPVSLARSRRDRQRNALRQAWPDVMADLISGVRAGLSLPECCSSLARMGPRELREGFSAFGVTYAASGSFDASLTRLRDELEDPVADRVIAVLRMAHEVGGNDLVRILRTSAELIREDLRIRGEIKARWSWTITAARLAAGAPFLVLLIMGTRPEAAAAYASPAGTATIVFGVGASIIGYRLMRRAARLPEERRIR